VNRQPSAPPRTHWDSLVDGYDPVMSADASYRSLLATAVAAVPAGAVRILDLGSGTGTLSHLCRRRFPEASVTGLDPAPAMVEQATQRYADDPGLTFVEGTAADLGAFPDEAFDAVVSNFALHHLTQAEKPLCAAEVRRVLRPGGRFVIADQFCRVMGARDDPARVLDVLDILTTKARYYLEHASLERMLLQLDLLPRFVREDGEILCTPQFWLSILRDTGFTGLRIVEIEPVDLLNRVLHADKPVRVRP
jgi:ubiquinone/menaquinone biosynthesis C-methylase UbiE